MLAMADGGARHGVAKRERLAQRRKALGLTQEDLAGLLGVQRSTVVRWERGGATPLPFIRPKLARALRVPASRLAELLANEDRGDSGHGPRAAPGASSAATAPRQLPAAVPDFTGRGAELAALTRILDDAGAGPPGAVVIFAIGGTAGVGKTALALHWAHQVADRFPDGQLYVNLRGFDPSGSPAVPAEALRGFLDALGVPSDRVPPTPDAQAGLYRSLLADKRMLIVLDNARDEQQVRSLLPASSASQVVVTSRNQLAGLAAADGARLLTLDVLSHGDAVRLLTARLGAERAGAEPAAVADIATRCACLPLALAVATARAAARPGFPIAALAAELRDAGGRLDALDSGDPSGDVRAVFSWSYQQLSPAAARMFRLLGVHPGPDISAAAAASLAAVSEPQARRLLRELTRAHLVTEHAPARYASHDLLRAYAAAQARDSDSESDRAAATGRILDHYLHTGYRASLLIEPAREPIALAPPRDGVEPESLDGYQQAVTWFETERQVLSAAIARAAGSGFDRHAWQLPWVMADYLDWRGHWDERVALLSAGLASATRLGDAAGQAVSGRLLGHAYFRVGDYDQATARLRQSLELYRDLGDRTGAGKAHVLIALVAEGQGRFADALDDCEQALALFRDAGYPVGEALTLNNIGWFHGLLGDHEQARTYSQRSLTLSAELGYRRNEGFAEDSLGYAEHALGNFTGAVACYQRAIGIFRELGDRYYEANSLGHLGDTHHAAGELPRARQAWQQALAILDDTNHAAAGQVRAKLASAAGQDLGRRKRATR
jgi:tetratricopeptide (TPR) repeat protein/transcriptional regulator with XRE-family HTH domain